MTEAQKSSLFDAAAILMEAQATAEIAYAYLADRDHERALAECVAGIGRMIGVSKALLERIA